MLTCPKCGGTDIRERTVDWEDGDDDDEFYCTTPGCGFEGSMNKFVPKVKEEEVEEPSEN